MKLWYARFLISSLAAGLEDLTFRNVCDAESHTHDSSQNLSAFLYSECITRFPTFPHIVRIIIGVYMAHENPNKGLILQMM